MSFIEEMSKKTIFELKSYAKQNNINLDGVSKKNEILEIILSFNPEKKEELKEEQAQGKVALYSERNLTWNGTGSLQRGYNIVTKEASEKWLKHKAVREASPKEVAQYFGEG
jgi:hypothetical protein